MEAIPHASCTYVSSYGSTSKTDTKQGKRLHCSESVIKKPSALGWLQLQEQHLPTNASSILSMPARCTRSSRSPSSPLAPSLLSPVAYPSRVLCCHGGGSPLMQCLTMEIIIFVQLCTDPWGGVFHSLCSLCWRPRWLCKRYGVLR